MKFVHNFPRCRLTVLSVVVLLMVSFVHPVRAEERPFRIILPAPGRIKGRPTTHEKNSVCLAHWLRDRFRADPRVRIVDQSWSGPVVGNLRSAKWASPPKNFLKTVSHHFPTDAVVEFGSRDEQFVLKLHLTDRPAPAELTIKEDQSSKQFFQKTRGFLLSELDLPAETEKSLAQPLGVPSRTFRAVYLSLQQVPNWKYTTAEPRIEMLKPHLKYVEKSPLVAYSIVKAGEKLTTEHKEAKKPESVMRVVRAVFPFLLGTEREKTAYKFLRRNQHNRDWFEEDLLKMIKPLATDEMDNPP
ncbi:MAG: hypothetical protein KGZ25_12230, partial [Planctomycetes bacterium]|nr:hypothetical protein [Planctomycetota bacterium]